MRITPVAQLTFGILSVTLSLLFIAFSLGLVPNEEGLAVQSRAKMSENLAIQLAVLASRNDTDSIKETIIGITGHGQDLQSVGIRKPDGSLIVASDNHEKEWKNTAADTATNSKINIPLMSGDHVEGNIELLFNPLSNEFSILGLSSLMLSFIAFMGGLGMVAYYSVLKRSLRELDPSSAFPDRVHSAFNALASGVIILDENNVVVLVNDPFQKGIYGQTDLLTGKNINQLAWVLSDVGRSQRDLPWQTALRTRRPELGAYMSLRKPSGLTSKLVVNATPIINGQNSIAGVIVTFDDVTALYQKNEELNRANAELRDSQNKIVDQNEQLRVLASIDALTGCLNRRTFLFEAAEALNRSKERRMEFAVLMLDIDHFKQINDQLGHAAGDAVLSGVGEILRSSCSNYGIVGRYGGEEFSIVFTGLVNGQVQEMAEYIRKTISAVDTWLPEKRKVTVSIGYSMMTNPGARVADLLNSADEAMYAAKAQGRDRVVEMKEDISMCA